MVSVFYVMIKSRVYNNIIDKKGRVREKKHSAIEKSIIFGKK
jgi:hypothetical protein